MSRLKRFSSSLISGYLLLGANVAFSLASIPLALKYLSQAEFGLWALASQVALYVSLLDFGMSTAGMRILIDHKDDRASDNYGSLIQTSVLVNLVHAALVIGGGFAVAFVIGPLLGVPVELQPELRWLLIGQSALTAVGYAARTAPMILSAHQRFETYNLAQALLFGLGLLCLWIGFRSGLGIFSLMWAQGITQILGTAVAVVVCFRAKLFPAAGRWGRPGWRWFWELFSYGRDMFLFSAGNLLINFSQTILITRVAGLEVAAVWAVCTRTFFLSLQIVTRLSDYAWSALAEMMVRSERERLLSRFQSMAIFSASVSVVAGVAFGLGNQPFVEWWTGGRIGWSAINDWLLAAWLVILTFTRSHIGLAGLTKQFRFLRYLYFVEGLFSVGLGYVALRLAGPTGMLVVFVCGSLFVSFSYGVWRTSDYFKLTWSRTAFGWLWPAFRLACLLVPLGLAISWLVKTWPPSMRFILLTGFVGVTGLVPLFRWGLDGALRKEIGARLPSMSPRWQTWFVRLTNISPPASRTDRRG